MKKLAILIMLPLLSACTAVRYNYRAEPDKAITCPIGPARIHLTVLNVKPDEFRKATSSVFNEKGITPSFVENQQDADIQIQITRDSFYTLPQEYLTGLSLGIIPSWGTRKGKFEYRIVTSTAKIFINIDETTYNHILLMPVCLVELPFVFDTDIYKKALNKYINTQPTNPPYSSPAAAGSKR
jgi:hypothetical protein